MQDTATNNYKLKTLKLSVMAISSVVIVELILGLIVGSLAIVSDGLHALLDALTSIVLLLATRASLKPADEEHMYGHEKFESIGGLVGGLALVAVALLIMYEAILRVVAGGSVSFNFETAGFIAIGYTFCIDFMRVGIFSRATKYESTTLRIGLYHALADLGSTIIALIGFGLATLGIPYGDAVASMILSVLLTYMSVRLIWSSAMELSDTASKDVTQKVRREIENTEGIYKYKDLKIRKAGPKTFVEAAIQIPEYMSLDEAHELASQLEANIVKALGNAEAIIHVEPPETGVRTEKLVEELATEVEGIKEVHEVNTTYTKGELFLTLHACVDPDLSVEETHEKAEQIEEKITSKIKEVKHVAVHMEPFSIEKRRGSKVDESEVNRIVQQTAEAWRGSLKIKKVVTYVAEKKRYVNIDCVFARRLSIEEAHKISQQIEDNLRQNFAETIVTVHMEPEKNASSVPTNFPRKKREKGSL
jgi:cation diffusion facilitator family transporter